MKAKEFSRTYGVPHWLTYEATFALGDRYDLDPKALAAEVRRLATERKDFHRVKAESMEEILRRLEGV